jgi:hypothetical protein
MDQQYLDKYFSTVWVTRSRSLDQYKYSGWALLDQIQPGESVLDVGCGQNPFKGHIENLVGVDPAFDEADVKCTIERFTTDQRFDVAFCLGSINFGQRRDIERQITKVVSLLKPQARIYWRCNPGSRDHGNNECEIIDFYDWSVHEHVRLAEKFGFRLMTCRWDTKNRLYAEWHRA